MLRSVVIESGVWVLAAQHFRSACLCCLLAAPVPVLCGRACAIGEAEGSPLTSEKVGGWLGARWWATRHKQR